MKVNQPKYSNHWMFTLVLFVEIRSFENPSNSPPNSFGRNLKWLVYLLYTSCILPNFKIWSSLMLLFLSF